MPTTTVQQLIDRARSIADMHDGFIHDTEWEAWATQERLALDLLLARSGWDGQFSTSTITVTGSENGAFTLVSTSLLGMLAVIAVHEVNQAGMVRRLDHDNQIDFFRQLDGSTQNTGHGKSFRLKRSGDDIIMNIWPTPVAGYRFIVTYIPHPNSLGLTSSASQDSSVTYPMGWEERIVLGMARRALIKEESDFSSVQKLLTDMESQIEELCWAKVMSDIPSIRNVDLDRRGWTDRLLFPPWQQWAWL